MDPKRKTEDEDDLIEETAEADADEPDTDVAETDTGDTEEPVEDDAAETGEEDEQAETGETDDDGEGEPVAEDSLVLSFDGEELPADADDAPADAPGWVKELRKTNRDQAKRIRDLERELADRQPAAAKEIEPGPRPTLESVNYDEDKLADALEAWTAKKAEAERQQQARKAEQDEQAKDYEKRLARFNARKAEIRAPDMDDAEERISGMFSRTQQGILVHAMDDPAMLVLALGRSEAKAKELAGIKDPVRFAAAAAKMEARLKVSRKKPPAPESKVRGSGRTPGGPDKKLDRLEAEAERTGDRTKVIAYRKKLKASA